MHDQGHKCNDCFDFVSSCHYTFHLISFCCPKPFRLITKKGDYTRDVSLQVRLAGLFFLLFSMHEILEEGRALLNNIIITK